MWPLAWVGYFGWLNEISTNWQRNPINPATELGNTLTLNDTLGATCIQDLGWLNGK